jgi:hypothetical protein
MNIETITTNSIGLIKLYCPNLFRFITEAEFSDFIRKSYQFVEENEGKEKRANFLSSLLELSIEHVENNSKQIRIEYVTLNVLLTEGIFNQFGKKLKGLIKGSILNFSDQLILDVMGELGACSALSSKFYFENYEHILSNGKSIDFVFSQQKNHMFIEILNIKIDASKYQEKDFNLFLSKRVLDKYRTKTKGLPLEEKEKVCIFPVLHGATLTLIQEQKQILSNFIDYMKNEYEIKSFSPFTFYRYNNDEYYSFKPIHEI